MKKNLNVAIGVLVNITMGQSPKGDTYNNNGNGMPLLNGPTEFGEYYPICTQYTTDSKRESKEGDLIFCVRGSTTGRMNTSDKVYSLGRGVCSISGANHQLTKYVRYALDLFLPGLLQLTGGGTFPNLTKNDIAGFEIPFNNDSYAQIVTILSAYDDLIENNLRRIKLLEEAARCEYKMLMKEETETVKLIDLYDTSSGGTPSKAKPEYYGGTIPFYKTKELQDSLLIGSEEHITDTAVEKSSAKLFPAGTVLLAMYGATIGRLGILTHDATTNQACCAITAKYEEYSNYFIYQFLLENREYVLSFRMGAAQENISQTIIKDFDVPKFSTERMNEYNLKVSNYFALIENLTRQNKQLRHARDILLPKLMSGEIDVEGDISTKTIIEMPTNETMAAEDAADYSKSARGSKLQTR